MQYLLKSLTTQKAKDAIEGINTVAEAYPEAIAAFFKVKGTFWQASKNKSSTELKLGHCSMSALLRVAQASNLGSYIIPLNSITGLLKAWLWTLDLPTIIEWKNFAQLDKDVLDYYKVLEFLDLRSTATELAFFDAGHKKVQVPTKKPAKPGKMYSTRAQEKMPRMPWSKT